MQLTQAGFLLLATFWALVARCSCNADSTGLKAVATLRRIDR